jgi:DNA-directed RNA polymerase subunit RPC12/RpoP
MSEPRHEGPDHADQDLMDDAADLIDCPHCGGEIYAYAERCPQCGTWLSMKHREPKGLARHRRFRRWWPVVVGLVILAFVLWLLL